ncbi:FMN-binding protein [Natroniella acetigena]|uniref:FMN-binding protein n=1 Tax=Natroniella acetigena TaxID=52004 RepID=UPI00200B0263|nr:FMN-binding protein [Natroniella acetigena]MCK8827665.1 FMN-binding protein [Natroniella acetigena]
MIKIRKKVFLLLIGFVLVSILVGCINVDVEGILADTHIENVDLIQVQDGRYEGEHIAGEVVVVVAVEVEGHQIKDIEILKHENWRGSKAELIVENVLEEQTLEVDVISGATISSKTILKATENALREGVEDE